MAKNEMLRGCSAGQTVPFFEDLDAAIFIEINWERGVNEAIIQKDSFEVALPLNGE